MQTEILDEYDALAIPSDATIIQVKRLEVDAPYMGEHYARFCATRGIAAQAKAEQDSVIAEAIRQNSISETALLDTVSHEGDAVQRLICGSMPKYPGRLLYAGMCHASLLGFEHVVYALPDLMFINLQYAIEGIGDEIGLRQVIKTQADDPSNKIRKLSIVVEYNTTLAYRLHTELGL